MPPAGGGARPADPFDVTTTWDGPAPGPAGGRPPGISVTPPAPAGPSTPAVSSAAPVASPAPPVPRGPRVSAGPPPAASRPTSYLPSASPPPSAASRTATTPSDPQVGGPGQETYPVPTGPPSGPVHMGRSPRAGGAAGTTSGARPGGGASADPFTGGFPISARPVPALPSRAVPTSPADLRGVPGQSGTPSRVTGPAFPVVPESFGVTAAAPPSDAGPQTAYSSTDPWNGHSSPRVQLPRVQLPGVGTPAVGPGAPNREAGEVRPGGGGSAGPGATSSTPPRGFGGAEAYLPGSASSRPGRDPGPGKRGPNGGSGV
ncbi:hypothetical protein CcI6DRAFT_00035, partial [Frankia sp. CcI6]